MKEDGGCSKKEGTSCTLFSFTQWSKKVMNERRARYFLATHASSMFVNPLLLFEAYLAVETIAFQEIKFQG